MKSFGPYQKLDLELEMRKKEGRLTECEIAKLEIEMTKTLSFESCHLSRVTFTGSGSLHLLQSEMERCQIREASVEDAVWLDLKVRGLQAQSSEFRHLTFGRVEFEQCDLRSSCIRDSVISNCSFQTSDLSYGIFRTVTLMNTSLADAGLEHAAFDHCTFIGVRWPDSLEFTRFESCHFIECTVAHDLKPKLTEHNTWIETSLPAPLPLQPPVAPAHPAPVHPPQAQPAAKTPQVASRFSSLEMPSEESPL